MIAGAVYAAANYAALINLLEKGAGRRRPGTYSLRVSRVNGTADLTQDSETVAGSRGPLARAILSHPSPGPNPPGHGCRGNFYYAARATISKTPRVLLQAITCIT